MALGPRLPFDSPPVSLPLPAPSIPPALFSSEHGHIPMPAPRPSQSAEAARAAAAQAEFNEKKWVWVPDDKDGYLAGWVVKEEDDIGEVVMASGGEVHSTLAFIACTSLSIALPDPQGASLRLVQDESTKVRQSRRHRRSHLPQRG